MTTFARALPEIRATVAHDLNQPGLGRSRVLALGMRLLDIGMFRVGGEEYAEAHETYGLATLEKRHVKLRGGTAIFDYCAKGGAQRLLEVSDPGAVAAIAALRRRRGGGAELLAWREGAHWVDVRSHDINAYLKEVSGGSFTAKDFRTWDASLLAAVLCAQATPAVSASAKARRMAGVVREVAEALGNTPAVCRKSYIDPRIFDRFEHGETIEAVVSDVPRGLDELSTRVRSRIERAVVELLESGEPSPEIAVA